MNSNKQEKSLFLNYKIMTRKQYISCIYFMYKYFYEFVFAVLFQ